MQVTVDSKSVRTFADRVVNKHPELTKPKVLEMLAHAFGYANFDTLSGLLKEEAKAETAVVFSLSAPVDIYLECYVCDDFGDGPGWAVMEITQSFLSLVADAQRKCQMSDLNHISVDYEPDEWEGGHRMDYWALYVSKTRFWFRGVPKHCNYAVESRAVTIDELYALLTSKQGTEAFRYYGDVIFHDSCSAASLYESAILDALSVDESAIAEWVGLHYRVNFDAESEDSQKAWVLRYLESH